ncbi:hypothetical protein [Phenylobacterium montanum]|uniref:Uncharacterized protein n=1 Tax=Phenylobacterium montanum TaxID=2823693 RepID=A0A975G2A1_9CAUL|nr:hypothetical protein [Caulobacter sp. S6]QUD89242.1 hypothetical protein KCG34_05005 [Caulobacter sp. S6]
MTSPSRAKSRRRKFPYAAVGTGFCVVVSVAAAAGLWIGHRNSQIAEAQAWAPPGPACPVMTRQAYLALGAMASHISHYDGVQFGRGYGAVACNEIADHGGRGPGRIPVCQFNNPTTLEVVTARGDFLYFPQVKPAVVTISDGRPTCVESAGEGMP